MGLLSAKIPARTKLSLNRPSLELVPKEKKAEAPKVVERPLTEAERTFNDLAGVYPLLHDLASALDLRDPETEKPPRKAEPRPIPPEELIEPENSPSEAVSSSLANKILKPQSNELKITLLLRIMTETGQTKPEAEEELQKLIDSKEILETLGRTYYLANSTPF